MLLTMVDSGEPVVTVFDHRELVRRYPHVVARFRQHLRDVTAQRTTAMVRIEHEHNKSCCKTEAWETTLAALVAE